MTTQSIAQTVEKEFHNGLSIAEILAKYGFKRKTVETYYSDCRMKQREGYA